MSKSDTHGSQHWLLEISENGDLKKLLEDELGVTVIEDTGFPFSKDKPAEKSLDGRIVVCFVKIWKWPSRRKYTQKSSPKTKRKKGHEDYLIEDPSIRHEARSRWEAEDIYDEDDFCER